jgi:glycosyltransferase involved in cell wall biosynthesis
MDLEGIVANAPTAVKRFGLIGRISPWKGQHIFLRAAEKVHQRYPETRFLIIGAPLFGEEAYEAEIHKLTETLHLDEAVQFTGFCTDVPERIAALDVVVHASTSGEPFGQVIIEGMAAAKPVIATNGGGVPEIVEEGVTGLLVPMGDASAMSEAMIRLLNNPEEAAAMGRQGRKRVEEAFMIQRTAAEMRTVFESVLAPS